MWFVSLTQHICLTMSSPVLVYICQAGCRGFPSVHYDAQPIRTKWLLRICLLSLVMTLVSGTFRYGPCDPDILRPRMLKAISAIPPPEIEETICEVGCIEVCMWRNCQIGGSSVWDSIRSWNSSYQRTYSPLVPTGSPLTCHSCSILGYGFPLEWHIFIRCEPRAMRFLWLWVRIPHQLEWLWISRWAGVFIVYYGSLVWPLVTKVKHMCSFLSQWGM